MSNITNKIFSVIGYPLSIIGAIFLVYTYTDFGFIKSEITAYTVSVPTECESGDTVIDYRHKVVECSKQKIALLTQTYKVNIDGQQVMEKESVYNGNTGVNEYRYLTKAVFFNDCSVLDRKNWECTVSTTDMFDDPKPISWKIGFVNGIYFDTRNSGGLRYVSRWEWFRAK